MQYPGSFYLCASKVQAWPSNAVIVSVGADNLGFYGQVLELTVVDLAGQVLMNTFVRPGGRAASTSTDAVVQYLHYLPKDIANWATWPMHYPKVCALLQSRPVIGHNIEQDMRIIQQSCVDNYMLNIRPLKTYCTQQLVASASHSGKTDLRTLMAILNIDEPDPSRFSRTAFNAEAIRRTVVKLGAGTSEICETSPGWIASLKSA